MHNKHTWRVTQRKRKRKKAARPGSQWLSTVAQPAARLLRERKEEFTADFIGYRPLKALRTKRSKKGVTKG